MKKKTAESAWLSSNRWTREKPAVRVWRATGLCCGNRVCAGSHFAGLFVSLLLFSVVGVFVVFAEVFEVGVAFDLVHAGDHVLGEPGQLGTGQRRDRCKGGGDPSDRITPAPCATPATVPPWRQPFLIWWRERHNAPVTTQISVRKQEMELISKVGLSIGGKEPFYFNFDDAGGLDTVAVHVNRSGLVYYEVPFPTVLGALVGLNDMDFFDVGANTGIFSLLAASANENVSVVAFEPIPSIADLMDKNVLHNPALADRIKLERIALSEADGTFIMAEHLNPAGHVATSSTLETQLTAKDPNHKGIDVEVCRLDAWMRRHPSAEPGVFKVDVEGHERAFFEGAMQTIKRYRPFIIVELLGDADFGYFDRFLYTNDYCDLALFPGLAALQGRPAFLPQSWNHLFCPKERMWQFATICGQIGLPIG